MRWCFFRSPERFIDYHNSEAENFLNGITRGSYSYKELWHSWYMRWKFLMGETSEAEKLLRYFASSGLSVRDKDGRFDVSAENMIINTVRTALETYRNGGKVNLVRKF